MISYASVGLLLGAAATNAEERRDDRPAWQASAGLAGHALVATIAEQAHYGWAGTLSFGAERVRGTRRPDYLGGAISVFVSRTPMGRRVVGITPGFEMVWREDRLRLGVEPVIGWLTIERSTGGEPQLAFVVGGALSVGYDLVRWEYGGLFVQARGQLAFGLTNGGIGAGFRF